MLAMCMPQNTTPLVQHMVSVVSDNVVRENSADATQPLVCDICDRARAA
jgi:hypothetical protein